MASCQLNLIEGGGDSDVWLRVDFSTFVMLKSCSYMRGGIGGEAGWTLDFGFSDGTNNTFTHVPREQFIKHAGLTCVSDASDLSGSGMSGSLTECEDKCTEINCVGFVRFTGGSLSGKCNFRGGTVTAAASSAAGTEDCFMVSTTTVQSYTATYEFSVRGDAARHTGGSHVRCMAGELSPPCYHMDNDFGEDVKSGARSPRAYILPYDTK